MTWSNSSRRDRLPDNWPALCAEVKRRAKGRCQAQAHAPGCSGIGTDTDHINQGDDHSLANLQLLSRPCHDRKTRLDNGAGMKLTLPLERHPMTDLIVSHTAARNRT